MHDADPHGNPWTTLDRRLVYDNPWIAVHEARVLRADGSPGIYGTVHFKNLAVGVLPVDADGRLWLVGQHRYPLDAYSWEIPEGGCPEGEDPADTARRELREETGLTAGRLELIATSHLSNSVSDEVAYVYRATELAEGPSEPEAIERLQVRKVAWDEAWSLLESGRITDSMSVIALLHEALRRDRGPAPLPPSRALRLDLLPGELAIGRLDPSGPLPAWLASAQPVSVTRTADELSVVAPSALFPADVEASRGWRALKVEGPFALNETGVLAALTAPLAAASVPIYAVSTFATDLLLTPGATLERAIEALRSAGHTVARPRIP